MRALGVASSPLGNAPWRGGRGWYGIRLTRCARGLSAVTFPSVAKIELTEGGLEPFGEGGPDSLGEQGPESFGNRIAL